MALVTLAVDDDGNRTGNTRNCKVPFYQALYEVWKNMAKDGLITLVRERERIPNNKAHSWMDFQLMSSVHI